EGVVFLAGVLPNDLAGEVVNHSFFDVAASLGARDPGRNVIGAVLLLATGMHVLPAIGVVVDDGVVIEDLASVRVVRGAEARLPTAQADRRRRRSILHGPQPLVDAMDGLLDEVIAREPSPEIPVAELVLHVAPALLADHGPRFAGRVSVPRGLNEEHVANGP